MEKSFYGATAQALAPHARPIAALLRHPRLRRMHFNGRCFEIEVGGAPKRAPGAHSIISKVFTPNYDYEAVRRQGQQSAARKRRIAADKKIKQSMASGALNEWEARKQYLAKFGGANGCERGDLIHQQVHDFVVMGEAQFRAAHPYIDGYAVALIKFFRDTMKTRLIFAEYPFFSEQMFMASSVDVIGWTEDGYLELIEIKTQYLDTFEKGTGRMHTFLGAHLSSNSAKNQALMQIYLTWLTFMQEYRVPCRARVVWVDEDASKTPRVRDCVLPPSMILNVKTYFPMVVAVIKERKATADGRPWAAKQARATAGAKQARGARKVITESRQEKRQREEAVERVRKRLKEGK